MPNSTARTNWKPGLAVLTGLVLLLACPEIASAGELDLALPPLSSNQWWMMCGGLIVCGFGAAFGIRAYRQLSALPVHPSMAEISELIYSTCWAYLVQQARLIALLELLVGGLLLAYFGFMLQRSVVDVATIIGFSLLGIAGSLGVAWFGIRVNNFANSRAAFASLRGDALPTLEIPLQAGMSIGTLLISVELALMLAVFLFVPPQLAGACFMGFAIGESLGASALRIAGGIFTKIADIGADLMKVVFGIKEDDARNPGVIADCTGDNAGDSVGPTADGFETYGVTGVALISFVVLAVTRRGDTAEDTAGLTASLQTQLLVWLFLMRVLMIVTSVATYQLNQWLVRQRYDRTKPFNFEWPLEQLVWMTSLISIAVTYLASWFLICPLAGDSTLWWKLSTIISCGTLAGALIPALVKPFTSMNSRHVQEVVEASREGGASLNILSGLIAGYFSAFWLGMGIVGLMTIGYWLGEAGPQQLLIHPLAASVFSFGLIAFGFLGMGPVTIAVDSYGPVTDNAQSVFELSTIEQLPEIGPAIERDFGFTPNFETAKELLEENDGAGNTFKATAKPVLIGTAVVGVTTLIFSMVVVLTSGLTTGIEQMSILSAPFLLGLISGGAVIYWFTGASMQAVTTGAYRAVEYIRRHIHLDEHATRASPEDSRKVVEICTQYAQRGMLNIFLAIFFLTLAFACIDEHFFIGYLISLAIFGLYQAIFMANAGGAWDNAKKLVEVRLRAKGTELHAATVIGDTVGDPFKDTSSVALNPVIKFTSLFGLLALELALQLSESGYGTVRLSLAISLFIAGLAFVYQSFYGMRIQREPTSNPAAATVPS